MLLDSWLLFHWDEGGGVKKWPFEHRPVQRCPWHHAQARNDQCSIHGSSVWKGCCLVTIESLNLHRRQCAKHRPAGFQQTSTRKHKIWMMMMNTDTEEQSRKKGRIYEEQSRKPALPTEKLLTPLLHPCQGEQGRNPKKKTEQTLSPQWRVKFKIWINNEKCPAKQVKFNPIQFNFI